MKVVLVNDTFNAYHWGCTATSRALSRRIQQLGYEVSYIPIIDIYNARILPRNMAEFDDYDFFYNADRLEPSLFGRLRNADIVVINGEGTLHQLTRPAVKLLFIAYAAKKYLKKNVQIINHSAYPVLDSSAIHDQAVALYRGIYNRMDFIAIREPISHRLMGQLGVEAQLSFDCLPLTVKDYYPDSVRDKSNYVVIADSHSFPLALVPGLGNLFEFFRTQNYRIKVLFGARNHAAVDSSQFFNALTEISGIEYEVFEARSLQSWLDCIGHASLLVSGRFHHSIAAAFMGTPFVLMESNTPKNQALAEMLKTEQPLSYSNAGFYENLKRRAAEALGSAPPPQELLAELIRRTNSNFVGLQRSG